MGSQAGGQLSLCWVRHIEIDSSSPSRTTTVTGSGPVLNAERVHYYNTVDN